MNQLCIHLRNIATVLPIHLSDCLYKNWKIKVQIPIRETSNRFSALMIEHTDKNPLSMDMSVDLGEQEKVGE